MRVKLCCIIATAYYVRGYWAGSDINAQEAARATYGIQYLLTISVISAKILLVDWFTCFLI